MNFKDIKKIGGIVHLSFSGDFGGREKVSAILSKTMNRLGADSKLYIVIERRAGSKRNSNLTKALSQSGVPLISFETNFKFSVKLIRDISSKMKKGNIAIVHCHCYKSLCYAVVMRLMGMIDAKIVHTLHGLVIPRGLNSFFIRAAEKIGLLLSDGVIGCSREVLESNLKSNWDKPTKVIINAIEPFCSQYSTINEKMNARERLNNLYGIDNNIPTVINIGRLSPQKDFDLYLRLIRNIVDRTDGFLPCNFLVVGDGELRQGLENKVVLLDIQDCVKFTGFVEDMKTIYLGADILVQTSFWEGTPMCLLEARSFGLPVVAPAVGGNVEVVRHGWDGALYPVGNLQELARETMHYLKDDALREEHGKRAFDHVKHEFGVTDWANKHFDFYKELLSARR